MGLKIKKFSALRMCVSDIKRSRDWYSTYFDIEPIEDLVDFVSFKIEGVVLEITKADTKSPLSPGGSVGYWLVGDFKDAINKAVGLKATIYRGPLQVKETNSTIIQLKDPFGNVFGLEAEGLHLLD